jgi:hypothetical protein
VAKYLLAPFIFVFFVVAAQADLARFQCRVTDQKETLNLEFVHDTTTNKAYVVGNAGLAEVVAHVGDRAITFLELLPTGAVQSTTIALQNGAAVHSRHSLFVDLIPAQFRGKCSKTVGSPWQTPHR